MFNHARGLWGYSGVADDRAPLTIQSTGVGGPSAAVVVAELHALGLRRAIRIGRGWAVDGAVRKGDVVAATEVLADDGASRALGSHTRVAADPALAAALAASADASGLVASGDLVRADPAWKRAGALLFDLESAAVLMAATRLGIQAATLVAVVDLGALGDDADEERITERLGRAALSALALDA